MGGGNILVTQVNGLPVELDGAHAALAEIADIGARGAHPLPGPAAVVLNESGVCFQCLPPGGNPAGEEFGRGRNDKQVQDLSLIHI